MKIIERLFELQELEIGPKADSPASRRAAAAIRQEIPPTVLGHYDRLMARGKKGVALVRHGVCCGCQMRLASGAYAALLRDTDICVCDNCARYLLLAPEETRATAAPAAAPPKPAARKRQTRVLESVAA